MPELLAIISHLCTALGLSSAAGLNAYIPLLTLAVMVNRGAAHVDPKFAALGSGWCIAILVVLLVVEIVVDKVPGADHINDMVQTAIRPAAGAVLFASQAGMIHDVSPAVWLTSGLLLSGGVHAAKATARPVVNLMSVGTGAPIVSILEDLVSVTVAVVAVIVPILAVLLLAIFGYLLYRMFNRFFGRGRAIEVTAHAVGPPDGEVYENVSPQKEWGGGV